MKYQDMNMEILKLNVPYWNRVISLDLETHVINEKFLTNERILAISVARRVSGNFTDTNGVEVKVFFLDQDTDESEKKLLMSFNDYLDKIKPLSVIGYGLRYYDIPLLSLKRRQFFIPIWNIVDITENASNIDLYHILKYRRIKRLQEAIALPEFNDLCLMKTKEKVKADRKGYAKEIYRLWRDDQSSLKEYCEGDVHDPLLIAEKLLTNYQ